MYDKIFNFEIVKQRYNRLMNYLALEHLKVGDSFSEDTENWNIRDMVAECDYQLSRYYDMGCTQGSMRYGNLEERKCWKAETDKLKRFINVHLYYIDSVVCVSKHCSKYDNAI